MVSIPEDFRSSLAADLLALSAWQDITPVAQRDFVTWIESAKQEKTRLGRIRKACSMLAAGKRRPCCYAVVPLGLYHSLDEHPAAKAAWQELGPMERRDFTDWIEKAQDKDERSARIAKACSMLASGRRAP